MKHIAIWKPYMVRLNADGKRTLLTSSDLSQMTSYNEDCFNFLVCTIINVLNPLLKQEGIQPITPNIINSSFRSKEHNERIGGSKNSHHFQSGAFDCQDTDKQLTNFLRTHKNKLQDIPLYFIIDYPNANIVHIQMLPFSDINARIYNQSKKQFEK